MPSKTPGCPGQPRPSSHTHGHVTVLVKLGNFTKLRIINSRIKEPIIHTYMHTYITYIHTYLRGVIKKCVHFVYKTVTISPIAVK